MNKDFKYIVRYNSDTICCLILDRIHNQHVQYSQDTGISNIEDLFVKYCTMSLQYRKAWEAAGIPFHKGQLLLLSLYGINESDTVRETISHWINPEQWVIDQYLHNHKLRNALDKIA